MLEHARMTKRWFKLDFFKLYSAKQVRRVRDKNKAQIFILVQSYLSYIQFVNATRA